MSTWNYRLVNVDGVVGLYEVYYDDAGNPWVRTQDPTSFYGESQTEVEDDLKLAIKSIRRGVLDDSEIGGL